MKQGKTLAGLGKELERQRKARKDFVADTRSLELASSGGRSDLAVIAGNDRRIGRRAETRFSWSCTFPCFESAMRSWKILVTAGETR